ncbi:DUF2913 family protein [Vibrio sp. T187]|uniref:DUF2913 family protein n=1 Tax=Vibrio TaxID=662 RepID=UPI0010C96C2D|nr:MULTISPECIES: DUF2913 family protein [Vibrio]MBW3696769.1 DUF2913 family protein [Vibrio sp. T187]
MSNYYIEIQKLVNTALEEITALHKTRKVVDAPVSNNHYLVRWVTKALKSQAYDRSVVADLTRWQKQGRSKGNKADLMFTFKRISAFYGKFFPQGETPRELKDSDVEAFMEVMYQKGWSVSSEDELTTGGKIQFFTDGDHSFALCAKQCDDSFEGELMTQPMNWFVRGNHAEFVEAAMEAGFMLHKVTDYKSAVKYHGEYIVYPSNQGNQLAEIPISFIAD